MAFLTGGEGERRWTGTKPRAMDHKLWLTVDPDRIPHNPRDRGEDSDSIGRCQMGCIVVAVDKTLPQAPQIRFTDAYGQGKLEYRHHCSSSGAMAIGVPLSANISSSGLIRA